jgi:20S proteasome alpha/beta subunit
MSNEANMFSTIDLFLEVLHRLEIEQHSLTYDEAYMNWKRLHNLVRRLLYEQQKSSYR